MFDKLIEEALVAARIDPLRFDEEIKKAKFKDRFDWFLKAAPASLVEAYNRRVESNRTPKQ